MVKADAKRDYYADLNLPATADAEDIKKQFRTLAKQYHPDRNPGKEVEVLSKFQAVQAAHEILSDPQQKSKYDADRAKLNRASKGASDADGDPYNFRQPVPKATPTSTKTGFPPPPPRPRPQRPPFEPPGGRPNPAGASAGAEKFSAFARPTAQWDRAKFDEAARADAARGFASMRSAQSTPQPPLRPPRHPTAPKPFPNVPADMPPPPPGPGPGFPGMSRTSNPRKGFDPGNSGVDEPMAPRSSAYATYNRGERPQASYPQSYGPDGQTPVSPTMPRQTPVSPLRHVRSSGFNDGPPQRPGLSRMSSRPYATSGGERTDITGAGMNRSASVRNSPTDQRWDENGQNGFHRPQSNHGPPPARHHSSSPSLRQGIYVDDSETSSEDEAMPATRDRPKAVPRRPRRPRPQTTGAPPGYRTFSADDPALTGQFPSNNYTKVVDDNPNTKYNYPPPESRDGPVRRPFANMTTPKDDGIPGVSGSGGGGLHRSGTWAPKYDSPPFHSRNWQREWGFSPAKTRSGPSLRGLPSWAVPSGVYPRSPTRYQKSDPIVETAESNRPDLYSHPTHSVNLALFLNDIQADLPPLHSSSTGREQFHQPQGSQENPNVSQENLNSTFSASDWEGKFSGDEYFRPTESRSRDRQSPSKTSRTGAQSWGKGSDTSQGQHQDISDPSNANHVGDGVSQQPDDFSEDSQMPKAAAFQNGKFSAEEWAAKLKDQSWEIPNNELSGNRTKTPKKGSKSNPTRRPGTVPQTADPNANSDVPVHTMSVNDIPPHLEDPDAMEIDHNPPAAENGTSPTSSVPEPIPSKHDDAASKASNGVDLNDLANTAPFAPTGTGLKDLDDLATTLPFQSRAADAVEFDRTESHTSSGSSIRHLNLPKAPKTINPPYEDEITQERWQAYVHDMYAYLHDWNVFNIKMIEHFRARQDQINVGMGKHWISSEGDGPSADNLDVVNLEGPRAGYSAYMQWLDDDEVCRTWWDEANERHRRCFQDLGRIRTSVKRMAGVGRG